MPIFLSFKRKKRSTTSTDGR